MKYCVESEYFSPIVSLDLRTVRFEINKEFVERRFSFASSDIREQSFFSFQLPVLVRGSKMADTSQQALSEPHTNGVVDGLTEDEKSKMRPADIDAVSFVEYKVFFFSRHDESRGGFDI